LGSINLDDSLDGVADLNADIKTQFFTKIKIEKKRNL